MNQMATRQDELSRELHRLNTKRESTPQTLQVPVYADYEYTERRFLRVAHLDASLRLTAMADGEALVATTAAGETTASDFVRDEQRAPGAPDLRPQRAHADPGGAAQCAGVGLSRPRAAQRCPRSRCCGRENPGGSGPGARC